MSIVRDFENAFNRQDVSALLACFTADGSYVDTFFGPHAGQAALRGMFQRMFHEGRDYAWVMDVVVETPAAAAAEWTFGYAVSDAIPRSAGRRVAFRGMSLFELEGGKIARYLARDFAGAIRDCEATLARKPHHFGALSGQGLCHLALEQYAPAAALFRRALGVHPSLASVRANLQAALTEVVKYN